MSENIRTIEQLVDALGGEKVVAETFGISQPAVANWKLRGQIAAGWHLRLLAMARGRKLRVDPCVFGLKPEDAKQLFGARVA